MERPVAIKVISKSVLDHPEALARFQGEVKAAARLQHPNTVAAYDTEQVGDLHMLVMEYVEGIDLAKVLEKKGPLPVAHACHYIRQAALGLQHAFEQGMVHRDIKPQNLMRTPRGQVKILDFGLARMARERKCGRGLTQVGAFMGTPEFVAPEQANDAHTADTRADIYSLGCTLYCLLAGRPPFAEEILAGSGHEDCWRYQSRSGAAQGRRPPGRQRCSPRPRVPRRRPLRTWRPGRSARAGPGHWPPGASCARG
jgi:serine/threonine protein kinase